MNRYAQTNVQLYEQLGYDDEDLRLVARAYDLATRLLGSRFRASGKTFLSHLVGTASVVARHGGEPAVVAAALLHAAYAQGDFGDGSKGPAPAKRARVRDAVGAGVEELVFRYDGFTLGDEAPDRDVLLIRLANELEETLDSSLRYCGAGKRDKVLGGLPLCAELARDIGANTLAAELTAAAEAARAAGAAPWQPTRSGSFTLAPLSFRRKTTARLRRLMRRLTRGGRSRG